MPELPEVETSKRGIIPHIRGQYVQNIVIRSPRLRWPIPLNLKEILPGQIINNVRRRGKYLLLETPAGTAILHLGMSGTLRIVPTGLEPKKHDHVDIELSNGKTLRFNDPRRFGTFLWTRENPELHPLLASLGPEPLGAKFKGQYLFDKSRGRKAPVKQFIMDSHIVVGVGNIYANEALFLAGIKPKRACGQISLVEYDRLAKAIKTTLKAAIRAGGTTLRNFFSSEGLPGHFSMHLRVYNRAGKACEKCKTILKGIRLGQRSTVYCPNCQK